MGVPCWCRRGPQRGQSPAPHLHALTGVSTDVGAHSPALSRAPPASQVEIEGTQVTKQGRASGSASDRAPQDRRLPSLSVNHPQQVGFSHTSRGWDALWSA